MSARLSLLRSLVAFPRLVGLAFILAIGLTALAGISLVAAQRGTPVEPAPAESYSACVNNHTGTLRIIPPDHGCAGHETLIQLGGAAADAALLERIEALEATSASQQTLIETQHGEIDDLQQANTDQQSEIEALQQTNTDQQGQIEDLTQQHADQQLEIATLQAELSDLSAAHASLQAQVPACLSTEGDEVYFTGCNVHIRSGSGATDGAINGLGNLIVGYNETAGIDTRTGSHNLVIGVGHTYTSFGGLVAGYNNTISGPQSSVSGGQSNVASGEVSSISGGLGNTASGNYSSASGGFLNTASGPYSSMNGGERSIANGFGSTISGGSYNKARGSFSSVSGGQSNIASDSFSSVGGGSNLEADEPSEFQPFTP